MRAQFMFLASDMRGRTHLIHARFSKEAFAALETALAAFFYGTAEADGGEAAEEASVTAFALLARSSLLLVLHGGLTARGAVVLALRGAVLSLRAIARLRVLGVTTTLLRVAAALLLVVVVGRHGVGSIDDGTGAWRER